MQKLRPIHITCGSCGESFPAKIKTASYRDGSPRVHTFEIRCPLCQTLQTVRIAHNIIGDDSAYRGEIKLGD